MQDFKKQIPKYADGTVITAYRVAYGKIEPLRIVARRYGTVYLESGERFPDSRLYCSIVGTLAEAESLLQKKLAAKGTSKNVDALTPKCVAVFLARRSLGLSFDEIGQRLSFSVPRVKQLLAKTERTLKQVSESQVPQYPDVDGSTLALLPEITDGASFRRCLIETAKQRGFLVQ